MEAFIRWAGSKRQIIPKIANFYSAKSRRYIEPFAGSACIFFHLEPNAAVLGDLNGELITAFREIRRDVYRVLQCARRFPVTENFYYKLREADPEAMSSSEAAARFLYLNRYCFNGLYRTNLQGKFNVPWGSSAKIQRFDENKIIEAASLLKRARLIHGDFEATLSEVKRNDFVYLDPPYAVDSRRVFSEYIPGSFSEQDLHRLSSCLASIDKKGARFILSYATSSEASLLTENWHCRKIQVRRNIAGFAGNRRKAFEVLVSNFHLEGGA